MDVMYVLMAFCQSRRGEHIGEVPSTYWHEPVRSFQCSGPAFDCIR
jgi:hypothetical protein